MAKINRQEKYYRDLVNDFNRCLTDADLDAAFQRVKIYVYKNFNQQDAERKNNEIINYQASFSRVSKHKRMGEIGYTEFNQELNKITLNIQEFVQTLKPDGFDLDGSSLIESEVFKSWNFDSNLVSTLIFQEGFSLLQWFVSVFPGLAVKFHT